MSDKRALTIDRDLDDVKAQVKKELDTIRELMDSFSYHNTPPGWTKPYQVHRLRRALRIHYLALKIRESAPTSSGMRELAWDLNKD